MRPKLLTTVWPLAVALVLPLWLLATPAAAFDPGFQVTTSSSTSSELSGPLRVTALPPVTGAAPVPPPRVPASAPPASVQPQGWVYTPPTLPQPRAVPAPPLPPVTAMAAPPQAWTAPYGRADAATEATMLPLQTEGGPLIYSAPELYRGSGALDVGLEPAWRRAQIPHGSYGQIVGRVPPSPGATGYVIGAGDTVQIDVLSQPELASRGNVGGDGRVTVALVGPVYIAGLTPAQAADRIAAAYKQGQYLLSPQVTVTITDYQSQVLTVLGEVRNPGRFPLKSRVSVLDGLALAGGVSEQGASTAFLLRPEGQVVTRYAVDLESLMQAGAGQHYFEMLAGDTLVVPKTEVFYIYGEVRNPNAYKLRPGMTVIQALSLAGGLTDRGSDRRIDLRRGGGSVSVSLQDPLAPDDVLYVRERLF